LLKECRELAEAAIVATDLVAPACPRCAALSRPGAPWCTQCFLDLRPAAADVAPAPPPALPLATPGWPCGGCGALSSFAETECCACGLAFLSGLTGDVPAMVLPGVGDLSRLRRSQLYGLAVLAVVLVMLLTAGAALLIS